MELIFGIVGGFAAGVIVTSIVFHISRSSIFAADLAYLKTKIDALVGKIGG